jgi:hypothetical protein
MIQGQAAEKRGATSRRPGRLKTTDNIAVRISPRGEKKIEDCEGTEVA